MIGELIIMTNVPNVFDVFIRVSHDMFALYFWFMFAQVLDSIGYDSTIGLTENLGIWSSIF